jgi:hypothetical protein
VYPYNPYSLQACQVQNLYAEGKGNHAMSFAGYYTFMPEDPTLLEETMLTNESAVAACVCYTTALQTLTSGTLTAGESCCSMAVLVTGWGFSGEIEGQGSQSDYYDDKAAGWPRQCVNTEECVP